MGVEPRAGDWCDIKSEAWLSHEPLTNLRMHRRPWRLVHLVQSISDISELSAYPEGRSIVYRAFLSVGPLTGLCSRYKSDRAESISPSLAPQNAGSGDASSILSFDLLFRRSSLTEVLHSFCLAVCPWFRGQADLAMTILRGCIFPEHPNHTRLIQRFIRCRKVGSVNVKK